jgi:hypothetical protein
MVRGAASSANGSNFKIRSSNNRRIPAAWALETGLADGDQRLLGSCSRWIWSSSTRVSTPNSVKAMTQQAATVRPPLTTQWGATKADHLCCYPAPCAYIHLKSSGQSRKTLSMTAKAMVAPPSLLSLRQSLHFCDSTEFVVVVVVGSH